MSAESGFKISDSSIAEALGILERLGDVGCREISEQERTVSGRGEIAQGTASRWLMCCQHYGYVEEVYGGKRSRHGYTPKRFRITESGTKWLGRYRAGELTDRGTPGSPPTDVLKRPMYRHEAGHDVLRDAAWKSLPRGRHG